MVRWGILSTARINRRFIPGLRAADNATLHAVASRDAAQAEAYARQEGIDVGYGSYEQLLADPDVDAVYIPLPNGLHLEWTARAIEAGKHVLCEKPLSRSEAEVTAAFDLADRHGVLLMEAFMYRHHPQTRRLQELVAGGAIGRLELIRGAFGFKLGEGPDVRLEGALDGGSLMDLGSYCVNAARMLAGEPEDVRAQQVIGGDGVDVAMVGTLRFPDHVLAHFDCGFIYADRHDLEVVGDEGTLYLGDPWRCAEPGLEWRRPGVERIEIPRADSYQLEVENFSAAVLGEGEPLLGRADAVGQARAIEALYEAAGG
jgi:D-xylose 1-dehydrogenase (NADP+, D-xylono-1,5-lactone-forming)